MSSSVKMHNKNYSADDLRAAVSSNLDSKSAEKLYKVPSSTIRKHRLNPLTSIGAGRKTYLNEQQESYLVSLIQLLLDYGYNDLIMTVAVDYMKSLNIVETPGQKWLNHFIQRHSDQIKWKKEQKLERARAENFNESTRKAWFQLLKTELIKLDLMDKPAQIFNADESGFADKTKESWVVVNSSVRHVFEESGGTGKNYTTALICISASGQVLPPFIIYTGKNLMSTWCQGGPSGAHYSVTPKGWINAERYEYWFEKFFIQCTAHINRPLLLIIDGHTVHVSLKLIDLMKQHQIICLMLPPHTTNALQPLDVVLFNNVKADWVSIKLTNFLKKTGRKTVIPANIPGLMKKLFYDKQAFSTTRIVSSFARAGIWPFNENAMVEKLVHKAYQSSKPLPTNILLPQLPSPAIPNSTNSLPPFVPLPISPAPVPHTRTNTRPSRARSPSLTLIPRKKRVIVSSSTSSNLTVGNNSVLPSNNPLLINPSPLSLTALDLPSKLLLTIKQSFASNRTTLCSTSSILPQVPCTLTISPSSQTPIPIHPVAPVPPVLSNAASPSNISVVQQKRKLKNSSSQVTKKNRLRNLIINESDDEEEQIAPTSAVRQVIDNLLSQRAQQQQEQNQSTEKKRGLRLNNSYGVNLTDADVALFLQQKEDAKKKSSESASSKHPRLASNKTKTRKNTAADKENTIRDPQTQPAYDKIQYALTLVPSINDNNTLMPI
ncbi:unnamed protein product [Didymodactylos carnosus]|uniref:DDE-1 domain-containing protein n=1 Tax=Didymodactylos carnosus TaxID=1234261 RepID=A0A8S2DL49_9BILA|nr:unnamed protein product [Didymodactylos carnosus]CAF3761758.1 unnamed protein product [Didymodactylos carnosus]